MTKKLEFNFDMNVVDAIERRPTVFKNFCQRYPNDADLGAKVREITNDAVIKRLDEDFNDVVFLIAGCVLLKNIADILCPVKKKKHRKAKF